MDGYATYQLFANKNLMGSGPGLQMRNNITIA